MSRAPVRSSKAAKGTDQLLIEAASREFRAHGYFGTDSNKIARRAGFAPQTFYRWFDDKRDIFLAVYRAWEEEERDTIAALNRKGNSAAALADAIVAHHRAYRLFRRSLRQLAVEDRKARRARAQSRKRQIAYIEAGLGASLDKEEIAVVLFQIERLADAIAEDEFADLGFGEARARAALTALVARLRG
jgi:AcrR family transcriptional regulator